MSNNNQYCPTNILVTGGAGFIGSNFVHYWLKEYPTNRVVVLDALTYAGNVENLKPAEGNPNFRFVHADILDYDNTVKLLREEKIDTIVHFAAESHVDRSITSPDAFIETNVKGTHELLKAANYRFVSFSLESVARQLLGQGKLLAGSHRGDDISLLFETDKPQLARYNLRDCSLVWDIFSQEKLHEFAVERSHLTGLLLDRIGGSVASFEYAYLHRVFYSVRLVAHKVLGPFLVVHSGC